MSAKHQKPHKMHKKAILNIIYVGTDNIALVFGQVMVNEPCFEKRDDVAILDVRLLFNRSIFSAYDCYVVRIL